MADTQVPDAAARIYAIGDIHGRLDLLDRAIDAIDRDVRERGGGALTVTLGMIGAWRILGLKPAAFLRAS